MGLTYADSDPVNGTGYTGLAYAANTGSSTVVTYLALSQSHHEDSCTCPSARRNLDIADKEAIGSYELVGSILRPVRNLPDSQCSGLDALELVQWPVADLGPS